MRPKIKTQFFEGIESINQFARDLLDGKIILCESLEDCKVAIKHIEAGMYDDSNLEEITLFIMPELEIELLAFQRKTDLAVAEVQQLLNSRESE